MTKRMQVTQLRYSSTNTYLVTGSRGVLLFDTGWAGTFRAFCREMGEHGISVQDISYILISHFHPDHCGIAQQIADCGPVIAVMDVQREYIHAADVVLYREPDKGFLPIDDRKIRVVELENSRNFLAELGIEGEVIATPGHSDDSISLCLDDGRILVGDLNPLYELEMHQGTRIAESWNMLLSRHPKTVYYGHARTAELKPQQSGPETEEKTADNPADKAERKSADRAGNAEFELVKRIMKYTDRGYSPEKIQKKTNAPAAWIRDVVRMYLTHPGVGVQGILDRIEIRGK